MWTWSPNFIVWQATCGRVLRWLVIATLLATVPVLAVWLIAPRDSVLHTVAAWCYAIAVGVGVIGGSAVYVALRGLAHRQLHRRLRSPASGRLDRGCPWCDEERDFHTLPSAVRESRDRLREQLRRAEFRD